MKSDPAHILLINPWIYDFAAFDFWARPLGLLMLGGQLRSRGYAIRLIDCLDRFHPQVAHNPTPERFGKGHFLKTPVAKPEALWDIPRNYSRYGIPEETFRRALEAGPRPGAVLVTSLMTYWYPGVSFAIGIVRDVWPHVPIYLGGIYATLCDDHAVRFSGADHVIAGQGEAAILQAMSELTGYAGAEAFSEGALDTYAYPCLDLQGVIACVPIQTGRGCPFRCRYCASGFLTPTFQRRSPEHVIDEICFWREKYGVMDFAFYDDALLVDADRHIIPILEKILEKDVSVRFHTPNALHIRPLTRQIALLMYRAGFRTIRLGLETAFFTGRDVLDQKLEPREFERAAGYLKDAGFTQEAVGAYLLFGLPGQNIQELEESVRIVKACGVRPLLAQYSPIPHTDLWEKAVASSRYDLVTDPIFHNNSIFPCQKEPFSWDAVARLKSLVQ